MRGRFHPDKSEKSANEYKNVSISAIALHILIIQIYSAIFNTIPLEKLQILGGMIVLFIKQTLPDSPQINIKLFFILSYFDSLYNKKSGFFDFVVIP